MARVEATVLKTTVVNGIMYWPGDTALVDEELLDLWAGVLEPKAAKKPKKAKGSLKDAEQPQLGEDAEGDNAESEDAEGDNAEGEDTGSSDAKEDSGS